MMSPADKAQVVLSRTQIWYPCFVGVMRKAMHRIAASEGKVRPDCNQQRGGVDLHPWDEVEAACAEYAVAMALSQFWPGDFRSKKKVVDIPPDIEVRWSKYPDGHLLIYANDDPDGKYVFVTGAMPAFLIHGWMFGIEGMQPGYFGQLREDRPGCFMIPQADLRPIAELMVNTQDPA